MKYFYITLLGEIVFGIYCIYKVVTVLKLFRKKKKIIYLIPIVILIPVAGYLFCSLTLPKIRDLKYAYNKNFSVYEVTIEKKYLCGSPCSFIAGGREYQYNPWSFKPKENNKYKLYCLPNSKFVVKYEKEK